MGRLAKKEQKEQTLERSVMHHPLHVFDEFGRGLFDREFPFDLLRHPWRWEWPKETEFTMLKQQMPAVDVIDREKDILVRAEVPGVNKEDLDISVTANTITIKGHTTLEEEEKKGEYFRHETRYGEFCRTVGLPAEVNTETARAKFRNGVLEVTVGKAEGAERRAIEIETEE